MTPGSPDVRHEAGAAFDLNQTPEELGRARRGVAFGRYARGMYVAIQPIVALIAGVLILVMPRLLNYIIAVYLIAIGILGLIR
jgi:hypothetical protein